MKANLTVNLNKEIIEKAKFYAKSNHISLSELIENYLDLITRQSKRKSLVSPLVESLTGIIPSNYDEKKEYRNYIVNKHS